MLDRARQALEDHAWEDAYEGLVKAEADEELTGEDLERLAWAAWWTARPKDCTDAMERAYAAAFTRGEPATCGVCGAGPRGPIRRTVATGAG